MGEALGGWSAHPDCLAALRPPPPLHPFVREEEEDHLAWGTCGDYEVADPGRWEVKRGAPVTLKPESELLTHLAQTSRFGEPHS